MFYLLGHLSKITQNIPYIFISGSDTTQMKYQVLAYNVACCKFEPVIFQRIVSRACKIQLEISVPLRICCHIPLQDPLSRPKPDFTMDSLLPKAPTSPAVPKSIRLTHLCYSVAWICALPKEMTAAIAMLDQRHESLPQHPADSNTYILGSIGNHDVVIACLPAGITSKVSAAIVATQIRFTFQAIKVGLMVGIGGGVPSELNDIRLGDVVVSQPGNDNGGVIQYDFGKTVAKGEFIKTGITNKPPRMVLSALATSQATHKEEGNQLSSIIAAATTPRLAQENFVYQGEEHDQLFCPDYDHPDSETTCSKCDHGHLQRRTSRENGDVRLFYGTVASGDQVMKHGLTRDKYAKKYGVLCYEMEAAGLDDFPCLFIRGISDYADSHKNDRWQEYAALTAAAYAKDLLGFIPTQELIETPTRGSVIMDPLESLVRFKTPGILRLPPDYSVRKLVSGEPGRGWQGYWHSPFAISDDRPPDYQAIFEYVNRVSNIPKPDTPPSSASALEEKLAQFMYNYRSQMNRQIWAFANKVEQHAVFEAMMQAAEGLIRRDLETGRTLFHYMAMNGVADILPAMANAGFDVEARDSDNRTPLHLAVIGNHFRSVKTLIEKCGANPHARDLNNALPWHHALHIDSDYVFESEMRVQSKKAILRTPAAVTELDQVQNQGPKEALRQLKEDPEAKIEFTQILVLPREDKKAELLKDTGVLNRYIQ